MNLSNIEKLNNLKNKIDLTRLWNNVLNNDSANKLNSSDYINLDNYVFRLNSLLLNQNKSSFNNQKLDQLIVQCENYLIQNSNFKEYLVADKEIHNASFLNKKNLKNSSLVECIELDVSSSKDNQPCESKVEQYNTNKKNESITNSNPDNLIDQIVEYLNMLKQNLKEENQTNIKEIIISISNKFNQNQIKLFCISLQDIENFQGVLNKLETNDKICSIKENDVFLILNIILELNSTNDNVLSYNFSYSFLRFLLSDYVTYNLTQSKANNNINLILSRKIYSLCCNLCKQMPNQFIHSCLVVWLMHINETTLIDESSFRSTNKIFIEFLVKLIKECFGERESIITMENLLIEATSSSSVKWTENVYGVLSSLIEKISNISMENLNLLIIKIQSDSNDLSKSVIFSKFLLLILNKYKMNFLSNNQDISKNFSTCSSSYSLSTNNCINQNLNQLVEKLSIIIQNNQTIMKKTLQTILNSFSKI